MPDQPRSYRSPRRERGAERTRQDILGAARELFVSRGYPQVTMTDIAGAAGTAVKTVYASVGTKTAILHELISSATADSAASSTVDEVRGAPDLAAATACIARGARRDQERFHASHDLLVAAMASDEGARKTWDQAIASCRGAFREAAVLLVDRGLIDPALDVEETADRLWFCFGVSSWRTLVVECGWDYDRAERWLGRQAIGMLNQA